MFKNGRSRAGLPSPALLIAAVALFIALGGTATALNGRHSVKRNDIAKKAVGTHQLAGKAVKASKIAPGQVNPFKLRVNKVRVQNTQTSTTSKTPVDAGGPSVSVKVPAGAMIAVQADVVMRSTGKGNEARVSLYEPTLIPKPMRILSTGSNSFKRRISVPGPASAGGADGVGTPARAGWIVMPSNGGVKTFSLRYSTTGGTALYAFRRLWVAVIR